MNETHEVVRAGGLLVEMTHGHKDKLLATQLMLTASQVHDLPRALIMREIERQLDYIDRRKSELDGSRDFTDRRMPELQPDGTTIMRDPITGNAWKTDGSPLPEGWKFTDGL